MNSYNNKNHNNNINNNYNKTNPTWSDFDLIVISLVFFWQNLNKKENEKNYIAQRTQVAKYELSHT